MLADELFSITKVLENVPWSMIIGHSVMSSVIVINAQESLV